MLLKCQVQDSNCGKSHNSTLRKIFPPPTPPPLLFPSSSPSRRRRRCHAHAFSMQMMFSSISWPSKQLRHPFAGPFSSLWLGSTVLLLPRGMSRPLLTPPQPIRASLLALNVQGNARRIKTISNDEGKHHCQYHDAHFRRHQRSRDMDWSRFRSREGGTRLGTNKN